MVSVWRFYTANGSGAKRWADLADTLLDGRFEAVCCASVWGAVQDAISRPQPRLDTPYYCNHLGITPFFTI